MKPFRSCSVPRNQIERAFHRKYDAYMTRRSPARRAYFVFRKPGAGGRRADILARIAAPSKLLTSHAGR